jgi:hypothetical protein
MPVRRPPDAIPRSKRASDIYTVSVVSTLSCCLRGTYVTTRERLEAFHCVGRYSTEVTVWESER